MARRAASSGGSVLLAQPSLLVFAALVAGILGGDLFAMPCAWCAAALGGTVVLWGVARRLRRGVALAALGVVAAAGAWAARQVTYPTALPAVCAPEGGLWQVRIDAPVDRHVQGTQMHWQTTGRLLAERCGDVWQPRTGAARLLLHPTVPVARGDRIAVRLRLSHPSARGHDFELAPLERLRRQRLTHRARVLSDHALIEPGAGVPARIDRVRTRGAEAFEAGLPPHRAALAKALALGDTAALAPAQRDAWAASGMAHLLSVSGLHVAIVALMASRLARSGLRWLPGAGDRYSLRALAAWCAMPPLLGFCMLTGAHPAALRATIMAGVALMGVVLGHPSRTTHAWGLAGAGMLMADPMAVYDVGFILSFAAVGALMGLVRPLKIAEPAADDDGATAAAPHAPGRAASGLRCRLQRMLVHLRMSWRVSLAATCVTAPITAWVFNSICWVAPWVNLVAVPLGSVWATPWALVAAMVAPREGWLQALCMRPLGWVLAALDGMAHKVGRHAWAGVSVPTPAVWEVALFAALVGAFYAWPKYRWRVAKLGVPACLALAGCIGWRAVQRGGDGCLWVRHMYVGQGDATLVTLPRGGTVLVDGGGSIREAGPDPGRNAVAPTLRRLNVHSIDWLVLTHPHPDHINGLHYIAAHWPVRHLLLAGGGAEFGSVRALQDAVVARGGTVVRLRDMPEEVVWEGVHVGLWHPRRAGDDVHPGWHLNDNSLVMHLQWQKRSILLAGDIEKRAEAVMTGRGVTADILKVGHHGSRTSSTLPFLETLRPHTAVISCGRENQFGFPHVEALERLSITGTRMLRTDAEGTIVLRSDGCGWFVSTVEHPEEREL